MKNLTVLVGIICGSTLLHATQYTLNWSEVDWVPSTAQSQTALLEDVDGSDIDVSVSLLINGSSTFASPTSVNAAGHLILAADYPNRNRLTNYIDVSFSFSQAVTGVSFSIEDLDRGSAQWRGWWFLGYRWEDVIEQVWGYSDSTPIAGTASFVGSGISVDTTTDPGNTLYRGVEDDNWSAVSRLTLSWDSPVDTVTFRYSGGENSIADPVFQVVGLSNITFYNAIPEPATYLSGVLVLGVLLLTMRRRKRLAV